MQILSTKLMLPPLRSRPVVRPRLFQKLDQGLDCGFILLSAPAGYGKSTLLNAWLNQRDLPAVWYTLDDGDNDPARFLAYLFSGLREIAPSISEFADGMQPSLPPEAGLIPVVNRLAQVEKPFLLVLDDFHVIQNQAVHQTVRFLLEHRPVSLRLAIATRADPPLALSRLRAGSEMVEIRLADLQFKPDEAVDFFCTTMGLCLPDEAVARLTARTEGWIAGMQIAALSIQNHEDMTGFVALFTDSHHQIFDYLLEEILDRQPPEIRHFLLGTCVLETLTPSLCDAMLSDEEGRAPTRSSATILHEMEHANLFINPLDAGRTWYRYHSLFADLLQSFIRQENPDRFPVLHRRASRWFENQGQTARAIYHSLAAKDWENALHLIGVNVFALLEQNELPSVARQLENLAAEKSLSRPWLWVGRAWLAAYTGQLELVEKFLTMIENDMRVIQNTAERQKLSGYHAAIRAYTCWLEARCDLANDAAKKALEELPATDSLIRCLSETVLGLSLNNQAESGAAFNRAMAYAGENDVSHVTIFAQACKAYLLLQQGKLNEAHERCLETIRSVQSQRNHQPVPTLSQVYSTLSEIQLEWDQLDQAQESADKAVTLAVRWQQADALLYACTVQGNVRFAIGDFSLARESLRRAWQVARRTSPWFEEIIMMQEIKWHLALNETEAAQNRLVQTQRFTAGSPGKTPTYHLPFTAARVYINQKRYPEALALLAPILDQLEKQGQSFDLVSVLLCQAVAYECSREYDKALISLEWALDLAAPEGYRRSFSSGQVPGLPLLALLHKARAKGIKKEYTEQLLEFLEKQNICEPDLPRRQVELVEPLTEREMDVLQLLAQGCSNKQIAAQLVIAEETARQHLKSIYSKMNVHSRTHAVYLAGELNIL